VGEGLVGLGHTVRVFTLAHGGTAIFGSLHELVRESERHRFSVRARAASITQRIANV